MSGVNCHIRLLALNFYNQFSHTSNRFVEKIKHKKCSFVKKDIFDVGFLRHDKDMKLQLVLESIKTVRSVIV